MKNILAMDIISCTPVKVYLTFRRNKLPPSPGSKIKPSKQAGEARCYLTSACDLLLLVTYMVYSSTLKLEAVRSFATSVNFYGTARHYMPQESTFQQFSNYCEIPIMVLEGRFNILWRVAWPRNFRELRVTFSHFPCRRGSAWEIKHCYLPSVFPEVVAVHSSLWDEWLMMASHSTGPWTSTYIRG
jgi:hypothetical protein